MPLISFTKKGLYCSQGNFYIDPCSPVEKAVITHGHKDHAYPGSQSYLCHHHTKPILDLRLGSNAYQTVEWGENVSMNGVKISLHPAGHIIGSSQVRVEHKGEVWVISGDYKLANDGISGQFEPVKCNNFITESTFGLPIYRWKRQEEIYHDIGLWIKRNKDAGKTSVLIAYSLGKAQRVLMAASAFTDKIYAHSAIWNMHEALVNSGWKLPTVKPVIFDTLKEELKDIVVIAPPSAERSAWIERFAPYSIGLCSGWNRVEHKVASRNDAVNFAISDHADWRGLLDAVHATGAQRVFVTHGFQEEFSRYLNKVGIKAFEVKTKYENAEEAGPGTGEIGKL